MMNRFSFKQSAGMNNSTLSIDEAYKILNLDRSKKITKEDVKKAHAKIQKKSILIYLLRQQDYRA